MGLALPGTARSAEDPPEVPARRALFGEMHIHTSWSIDGYVFGTRGGPEAACEFARGGEVEHPGGFKVKLGRPLDFTAVMDHSEYTGALHLANDPDSSFGKTALGRDLREESRKDAAGLYRRLSTTIVKGEPVAELQGSAVAGASWKRICEIADQFYEPGTFTTFPGWEWTSTPNNRNLHRNVFFRDTGRVPAEEFSSLDSTSPEDLWTWMDAERAAGREVIAVTHNGNLSDGMLYPRAATEAGRPFDRAYAEARMRNEPLAEVKQVKGQSETTPSLSPDDEFANYEVFVWLLLGAEGVPKERGGYLRLAYRDGIAMQGAYGFNPYKFGMIGASDAHGAVSSYRQEGFFGQHGRFDDTAEKRLSPARNLNMDNRTVGTAGLTGVYAEENTRESIWEAFRRKETFATSGPRMRVRLFGGWGFAEDDAGRDDWVEAAYARGVPMGGDLPAPESKAPTFIAWARKDPDGANLDRIQIVKGWAKNGQSFERVHDVAWSDGRRPDAGGKLPPVGTTVDISRGTYADTIGSPELKAVWTDPDFDPGLDAFYYARALQIPTPRWTTIDAAALGVNPPDVVPATVQDRAWTSPIWYTPDDPARRAAAGTAATVDTLRRDGATALDDGGLRRLIVGKTLAVRNAVTGRRYELFFGDDGRRIVRSVDGKTPELASVGDVLQGVEARYEIRDGRLITLIGDSPFSATVYALGDRLIAARGDEYGFANYEIEAVDP